MVLKLFDATGNEGFEKPTMSGDTATINAFSSRVFAIESLRKRGKGILVVMHDVMHDDHVVS